MLTSAPARAGDTLKRRHVHLPSALDDVFGQWRGRLLAMPVPSRLRGRKPIPDELFVKRNLTATRPPRLGGPESRRVRRQHLVCQAQGPGLIEAQLYLGVGHDDSALRCQASAALVDRQRDALQFSGNVRADEPVKLAPGEVLVMFAARGLTVRVEDRLRKPRSV